MLRYIICISIYLITAQFALEDGEFDLRLTKYEDCKGPKRKNCSKSTVKIEEGIFLTFDSYITEEMSSIKAKIVGMVDNKELLRLQIKNTCDHIFFRPLFQMIFHQLDRCGVFKGHYVVRMNIAEISHRFYGGKFIYGNWSFVSTLYNDYCNLNCNRLYITMSPKKS